MYYKIPELSAYSFARTYIFNTRYFEIKVNADCMKMVSVFQKCMSSMVHYFIYLIMCKTSDELNHRTNDFLNMFACLNFLTDTR